MSPDQTAAQIGQAGRLAERSVRPRPSDHPSAKRSKGQLGAWRVLIADDHAVTRSGIRLMAEMVDGFEVVGEAATGTEAIRLCGELHPDLVLMDLQMPEMHGIECTRRVKEQFPDIQVLILTVHEDEEAVFEAIRAGASGYLSKTASVSDVRTALDAVRSGGTYLTPSIAGIAIRSLSKRVNEAHKASRASDLTTQREREVLGLLAKGLSARAIASRLGISERTVNTHIGHAYRKLGVNNRVDAILAAMRLGLVETPR